MSPKDKRSWRRAAILDAVGVTFGGTVAGLCYPGDCPGIWSFAPWWIPALLAAANLGSILTAASAFPDLWDSA